MKRCLYIAIILLISVGLLGCEMKGKEKAPELDNAKNISIFNKTFYDRKHLIDIGSVEEISLYEDGSIFYRKCNEKETCVFYRGEYKIVDDDLTVYLNEISDSKKGWIELTATEEMNFKITDKNTFSNKTGDYEREFVLDN